MNIRQMFWKKFTTTYSSRIPHPLSRTTNPLGVVCTENGPKKFLLFRKTISDIEFRDRWRNSYARARFLIYHNVNFGVTILATDDGMRVLSECDNILCDDTFKACPSPYYQLYVIFGFWENRFIPLVFSFLSRKTTSLYRKLLGFICTRVRRITGQAWVPQRIITDYERSYFSIRNRFSWGGACGVFLSFHSSHISKCLWKRIKKAIWGEWSRETQYTAFNGLSIPTRKSSLGCNFGTFARKGGDRSY